MPLKQRSQCAEESREEAEKFSHLSARRRVLGPKRDKGTLTQPIREPRIRSNRVSHSYCQSVQKRIGKVNSNPQGRDGKIKGLLVPAAAGRSSHRI